MAKVDILKVLYSKNLTPLEFKFDSMWAQPMLTYITVQDIHDLYKIASSIRLSSKIELKYKMIDEIMVRRGFKKFACGTNRIVYNYLEDQSFVMKIAIDKVGLTDNPAEYKNQQLLKPFVTKIFEVDPTGVIAMVERVEPITSRQEFYSIAPDIFELLNKKILGNYILDDIGTEYFANWALRTSFSIRGSLYSDIKLYKLFELLGQAKV